MGNGSANHLNKSGALDHPPQRAMRRWAQLILGALIIGLLINTNSAAADNPGQVEPTVSFIDVTLQAGISASHSAVWDTKSVRQGYLVIGQAWGDYDNDGWLDLYLTGNRERNILFHNQGDATFEVSPYSHQVNLADEMSGGAVWADYDNDGWRDLYVLNNGPNVLFRNDRGQGFIDVTQAAGVGDTGKGESAAWGDYDNDGLLDLYVVNWTCYPECDPLTPELQRDRLYHNEGDGTFSDQTFALDGTGKKTAGAGFAASFADYDNDGDLDLYVVNDRINTPIGNVFWRNDGPGCGHWCWSDLSSQSDAGAVISGMGIATGDYDNDLDLDIYVSNMSNSMLFLQNQGDGRLDDMTEQAEVGINPGIVVGWGTDFFDYDNDGWLDLYLATTQFVQADPSIAGIPEDFHDSSPDYLFHNNGDGTFTPVTGASWQQTDYPTKGFAYGDYDNDGWLDFVIGNWNQGYRLFRNTGGNGNHWLSVRLAGRGPVNRDAVGARVIVTTDDGRQQMQEVKIGSSLGAGNDTALHFGLGTATSADVTVRWPDGRQQRFRNVDADQIWSRDYPILPFSWPVTIALAAGLILLIALAAVAVNRVRSSRA